MQSLESLCIQCGCGVVEVGTDSLFMGQIPQHKPENGDAFSGARHLPI